MEGAMTAQEMLKGLWRRRKLVLSVFALVFAVGVAVVGLTPSQWRATSVVRIQPQRPSVELVLANNTVPAEERMKTVRQELFARPLLETLVGEMSLFPEDRQKKGMAAAVEETRAMLDVKVEGETAFELTVSGPEPEVVAAIANRLPQLYAEQALAERAEQAQRAAALFDEEIARLGKLVEEQEKRVADFKLAHLGELPEQLEPNMRALERLTAAQTARIEARRELLRRAAELIQARADLGTELGQMRRRELELATNLVTARSQWTEDHPEVERLKREIASARAKREAAEQRLEDPSGEGYLRSQVASLDAEIASLEQQAQQYRQRIDNTARWAQQLSELTRDYEATKAKLQSLQSRKVEAEVSRELEAKARAGLFRVLSAADVPASPFKPNRATGILVALLLALGAGALAGIFLELQDDSVRRLEQARALSLPVLALVPDIPAGGRVRH